MSYLSTSQKSIIAIFLALKLTILFILPLTGDEAYFISWGQDLSLGYYDHPPVVGWVIYLLGFISDHYYFYRSFSFLISIFIAYLLYRLVDSVKGHEAALLVSLVFLLSPLSLFSIIFVNDVTLLLFGLLGFYCFTRALAQDSYWRSALSGVFFGLCFLSKYLSIPLFIGLFLYLVTHRKQVNWKLVITSAVIASLFVAENVFYNLQNCWNNIVFNLFSRVDDGFSLSTPIVFLASLCLVVPPQGIFRLLKVARETSTEMINQALYIASCFLVIFLLVSTFKSIGLHWLNLLAAFIYLLFSLLSTKQLRSLLKYNAILSIAIASTLLITLTQFDTLFADHKKYPRALIYTQTKTICENLPKNKIVYTSSYSKNSILSYHCPNNQFHVFANTSKYGREDDKKIDYSLLDGKTMLLFITELDDKQKIEKYFDQTKIHAINMTDKVDYYLVEAERFKFGQYKANIIEKISQRFYSPPNWLPESSCKFNTKYSL